MKVLSKIKSNVKKGVKDIFGAPRAIAKRFGLARRPRRHRR